MTPKEPRSGGCPGVVEAPLRDQQERDHERHGHHRRDADELAGPRAGEEQQPAGDGPSVVPRFQATRIDA
jgi:hypothetical protein